MAPVRVGVFFEKVQLSDITGIDLLGNCSIDYIKVAAEFGFGHLLPLAVDMEFLYISSTLEPAFATPSLRIHPTHTYDSAPRDLDILVVGGPPPSHRPEASLIFLKEAAKKGGTKVIMSTCVGSLWLADAGILDGRKATTNRGALELAKTVHPGVDWVDQRWVIDFSEPGKDFDLWTSGGAGAGIDMLALYASKRFDERIAKAAWEGLDFDPEVRGQFYAEKSPNHEMSA